MGSSSDRVRLQGAKGATPRRGAMEANASSAERPLGRAQPSLPEWGQAGSAEWAAGMKKAGSTVRAGGISSLQRSHGNLAVQRLVDGTGPLAQRQEEEEYGGDLGLGEPVVGGASGGSLSGIFSAVASGILGAGSSLGEGAFKAAGDVGSGLLGAGLSLGKGVLGATEQVTGGFGGAGSSLWGGVESALPGAIEGAGDLLSGDFEKGLGGLWGAGKSLAGGILGAGGELVEGGLGAGRSLWGGLMGAEEAYTGGVGSAWEDWRGGVQGAVSSAKTAGGAIWDVVSGQMPQMPWEKAVGPLLPFDQSSSGPVAGGFEPLTEEEPNIF